LRPARMAYEVRLLVTEGDLDEVIAEAPRLV
jgi:hypothetical protein